MAAKHRYRITVEHLSDPKGVPSTSKEPLQFEVGNHDELFSIVDRIRQRGDFDQDSATAFAIGLKLFGEVMLENKEKPLFKDFFPHFLDFMKVLKSSVKG